MGAGCSCAGAPTSTDTQRSSGGLTVTVHTSAPELAFKPHPVEVGEHARALELPPDELTLVPADGESAVTTGTQWEEGVAPTWSRRERSARRSRRTGRSQTVR